MKLIENILFMLVFIFMVTKLDPKGKIYRTLPEKKNLSFFTIKYIVFILVCLL